MSRLGRRSLFALPLVAPVAIAAASTAPANAGSHGGLTNRLARVSASLRAAEASGTAPGALETIKIGIDLSEWDLPEWCPLERRLVSRAFPRDRDLAATLGIPHEEQHVWTDEEVAATLGIDVQRDGISAVEALHRFVDKRSARRVMLGDLLDGKGA